jgi:hypothetical protein
MIRTLRQNRRPLGALGLCLMVAFFFPPPPIAQADDRKLLQGGVASPNVLLVLDTSGSMANDFSNNFYVAGGMDDPQDLFDTNGSLTGLNYGDPTPCHDSLGAIVPCVNATLGSDGIACYLEPITDPCHALDPVDAPASKLAVAKSVLKQFITGVENNGTPLMNLGFASYYQDYSNGGVDSPGIRGTLPAGVHGKQWLYTADTADGGWTSPPGYDGLSLHAPIVTQGEPLQFGLQAPFGWRDPPAEPNGAMLGQNLMPLPLLNRAFQNDASGTVIVCSDNHACAPGASAGGFFDMANSFDNTGTLFPGNPNWGNNPAGLAKTYGFDPKGHRFLGWQVERTSGSGSPFGDDAGDNNPAYRSGTCPTETSDPALTFHMVAQQCTSSHSTNNNYFHPVTLYHHTKVSLKRYKHNANTTYYHTHYNHTVIPCAAPDTNPVNSCSTVCPATADTNPSNVCATIAATCSVGPDSNPANACQTIQPPCTTGPDTNPANACSTIAGGCANPDQNPLNSCSSTCGATADTNPVNVCATIPGNPGTCTNCAQASTPPPSFCSVNYNYDPPLYCQISGSTPTTYRHTMYSHPTPTTYMHPTGSTTYKHMNSTTYRHTNYNHPQASTCTNPDTNPTGACSTVCIAPADTNPVGACQTFPGACATVAASLHDSSSNCGSAGQDSTTLPSSLTCGSGGYPYYNNPACIPADANGHQVVFATFDWFDFTNTGDYRTDGSEIHCGNEVFSTVQPDAGHPGWTYRNISGTALGALGVADNNCIPGPPNPPSYSNCGCAFTPGGTTSIVCDSVIDLNAFNGRTGNYNFTYAGEFAGSDNSLGNSGTVPFDYTVDGTSTSNTCSGYMTRVVPESGDPTNSVPIAPIPMDGAEIFGTLSGLDANATDVSEYIKTFMSPAASRAQFDRVSETFRCFTNGFTQYQDSNDNATNRVDQAPILPAPSSGNPGYSWWHMKNVLGVANPATQVFNGLGAVGGTPIVDSLTFALNYFQNDVLQRTDQLTACRHNFIIFLTDGLESCNTANPNSPCIVAQQLANLPTGDGRGVTIFAVAVGSVPSDPTHVCTTNISPSGCASAPCAQLDGISTATRYDDGVGNTPTHHLSANNRQELLAVLQGIAAQIVNSTHGFSSPASSGLGGVSTTGALAIFQPSGGRDAKGNIVQQRSVWDGHVNDFILDQFGFLPEAMHGSQMVIDLSSSAQWDAGASLSAINPMLTLTAGAAFQPSRLIKIQYLFPGDAFLTEVDYPNTLFYAGRKVLFGIPSGSPPEKAYDLPLIAGTCPTVPWCTLKGYYMESGLSDVTQFAYSQFVRGARDLSLGITPSGTNPKSYGFNYLGGTYNPPPSASLLGDVFHSEPLIVEEPTNLAYFVGNATYDSTTGQPTTSCLLPACPGTAHSYRDFFLAYRHRRKVLYVGANDTLFHAFDAGVFARNLPPAHPPSPPLNLTNDYDLGTGAEYFSYAPRATMPELNKLYTDTRQQFSVDGSPGFGDVFIDGNWHTIVAGGLREGVNPHGFGTNGLPLAPAIFALDITAPDNLGHSGGAGYAPPPGAPDCLNPGAGTFGIVAGCMGDNSNPVTKTNSGKSYLYPTILWEMIDSLIDPLGKTGDADKNGFPDLGETWPRPVVGRLKVYNTSSNAVEDRFVVITGGGFDPERNAAVPLSNGQYFPLKNRIGNFIYILNASDGSIIYKINAGKNNGTNKPFGAVPGTITAADFDTDGYIDALYFGDTLGNVWKVRTAVDHTQGIGDFYPGGACLNASFTISGAGCQNKISGWVPTMLLDGSQDKTVTSVPSVPQPIFTLPEVVPSSADPVTGLPRFAIVAGSGDRDDLFSDLTTPARIYLFLDHGITAPPNPATGPWTAPFTEPTMCDFRTPSDTTGTGCVNASSPLNQGYFVELNAGEKVTSDPVVANQAVTVSTFTSATANSCTTTNGFARIYNFNYLTGASNYCSGCDRGQDQTVSFASGTSVNQAQSGEVTGDITTSSLTQSKPTFGSNPPKVRDWKDQP